ncbi:hypothetical protein ACH5RR_006778 [Cinchona calisaya]|uniref:Tf2-1-like SH3-like domain-containing protein n=1 Tax=Cinchona calisaya TaxID=153742 RepID=A0ABD3APX8_9GENT
MTTRSGQSFRPRYTDKERDDLIDLILQKGTEIEAKLSEMDNPNFQSKPTTETNSSSGSDSATKNNGKNPVIPIIQEYTTHPQTGGDVLGPNQHLERSQASLPEMANQIIQSGSARPSVEAEVFSKHILDIHNEVRRKIAINNEKYKSHADLKRKFADFQGGDEVMVCICPERYPKSVYKKLHSRSAEPFKILKKISSNAYVLELPKDWASATSSTLKI